MRSHEIFVKLAGHPSDEVFKMRSYKHSKSFPIVTANIVENLIIFQQSTARSLYVGEGSQISLQLSPSWRQTSVGKLASPLRVVNQPHLPSIILPFSLSLHSACLEDNTRV